MKLSEKVDTYLKLDPVKICDKCSRNLKDKNENLYGHYLDICIGYIYDMPLIENSNTNGAVSAHTEFLEENGFVIGREINRKQILVQPLGHKVENDMHFFCCCKK